MLASKAVIFTHMPIPLDGPPHAYTAKMAHRLMSRIKPYLKAYLLCRNIGLVYIYVDTGMRLTLQHLAEKANTLQFAIGELEFEQNTRNCLKLAVDKTINEISTETPSFSPSSAPKIQFIGLPHLLTLIHSLYRIDPDLIQDLAGREQSFTYDSPKFVEAVIRLVRGADVVRGQYPILRMDEDVEVNETAIGLLLGKAREVLHGGLDLYSFFSGGYGSSSLRVSDLKDKGRSNEYALDPVNDYAVRLHWLVDRNTHQLSRQGMCFLRDLGEFGATQVSTDQSLSSVTSDFLIRKRKGKTANRASQQVISGAGLFMSRLAIRTLPPFMNFRTAVTWIDDHLKRRLHEVLGHIDPDDPDNIEHLDNALVKQERHKDGIVDKDIVWVSDVYFERLLSGCITHALITTPDGEQGELAAAVDAILQQGPEKMLDEEDLRKRLERVAADTALSVLEIWQHADYGSALLSQWAEDMAQRITSCLLYVSDLKNPVALVIKFRDSQDPLSQYLLEQLSTETQQQLKAYVDLNRPSELLKVALVNELNQVLKGASLYEKECLARLFDKGDGQLELPKQIRRLIEQNPSGKDLICLNRLLLEEAYPHEIAGTLINNIVNDSISYVHLVARWPQYIGAITRLTPVHAYWLFRNVTESEFPESFLAVSAGEAKV
jgi:hypothetical protein